MSQGLRLLPFSFHNDMAFSFDILTMPNDDFTLDLMGTLETRPLGLIFLQSFLGDPPGDSDRSFGETTTDGHGRPIGIVEARAILALPWGRIRKDASRLRSCLAFLKELPPGSLVALFWS